MRQFYYGYWLILGAFIAQFISAGMQNYVVGPFMVPMTVEFGWSRAEYTLPRTIGGVIMAITGFLIGAHVDRRGPKGIMLIGTLILALALFSLSKVSQLWHWVLVNGVILTVGSALIGNLVVNVTLIKWFVDFRGRAVAFAAMGVSFAGVLLTPFTTWAIDTYDWRFAWQLLALVTLVLVIPAALSMRRAPEDYSLRPDGRSDEDFELGLTQHAIDDFDHSVTRREALRSSTFYWLVIVFSLFPVTIQVMLLQTIPMMTDVGYDRTTAALMITVASVPALLSKPVWGWLIDGLQRPKPLAALSACIAGCSLFIIIFSVNAGFLGGLIGGFFLLGLGWGGMIPLQEVIWASFFGRRYLGAVRGAAMPFMLVLGAMAPISTSYYYDVVGNYDGAIIAVGCANLVSAFMIMLIKNHNTPAL